MSNEFLRERVEKQVTQLMNPQTPFGEQLRTLCDYILREMRISYRCGVQKARKPSKRQSNDYPVED